MALEIGEVLDLIDETPTVKIIKIIAPSEKSYDYEPGQFFNLYLAEDSKSENPADYKLARPYSVISSPANKTYLEIAFRVAGNFTQKLAKLNAGDRIGINGPFGVFTLDENDKDVVMLAGGIGITPFVSMLRYATEKNLPNRFLLLYSNRLASDISLRPELLELEKQSKNVKCVFTITRETAAGFEHGRIDESFLKKYSALGPEKTYYVCGSHNFITGIIELLEKLGVDRKKIKKEDFGFIKPKAG